MYHRNTVTVKIDDLSFWSVKVDTKSICFVAVIVNWNITHFVWSILMLIFDLSNKSIPGLSVVEARVSIIVEQQLHDF